MDDEEIPVEIYPTRRKQPVCHEHGTDSMARDPETGTWYCERCLGAPLGEDEVSGDER